MAQQGFMAPGAYDADSEQIRRRMAYAEMLGQQSQQAPQGQMVSGHFVAPSWTQHAANLLKAYSSRQGQDAAMKDMQGLSDNRRNATVAALSQYSRDLAGTPAQTLQPATTVDDEGNANSPVDVPAQAGNMQLALAGLLKSDNPMLQSLGMKGMAELPGLEAKKAERAEKRQWRTDERVAAAQQRADQLSIAHQQRMDMLRDQQASREQMAAEARRHQQDMIRLTAELKKSIGGAGGQPYFSPLQTGGGVLSFDHRSGGVSPVLVNGKPVIGAQADPQVQGEIAQSKAGGIVAGKDRAESGIELPKLIQQGEETIKLVDDLLAAPGFKQAVGGSRMFQIQKIPGTSAKDFDIRLDQLKGKQFLQAFESLKGGGQITEVEGKKATDAIARMDAAGTEEEFIAAAREFQTIIRQGVARAKQKAGVVSPQLPAPAPASPTNPTYDADKEARYQAWKKQNGK